VPVPVRLMKSAVLAFHGPMRKRAACLIYLSILPE
jgi:hypothetical protein